MPQLQLPIFPAEATEINNLLGFCSKDDFVFYFNGLMPIFSHHKDDIKSFRLISSQMVVNGTASQAEISRAFGVSGISVKRYVKLFREEGAEGFFKARKGRSKTVLTEEVLQKVQEKIDSGEELGIICKSMDLKRDTVSKAIRSGRLKKKVYPQSRNQKK